LLITVHLRRRYVHVNNVVDTILDMSILVRFYFYFDDIIIFQSSSIITDTDCIRKAILISSRNAIVLGTKLGRKRLPVSTSSVRKTASDGF